MKGQGGHGSAIDRVRHFLQKHFLKDWLKRRFFPFVIDFVILACIIAWWARWRFAGIYLPLLLALLINVLWEKRRRIAQVIYFLLMIEVLELALLSLFPLWCISQMLFLFVLLIPVVILLGLYLKYYHLGRYLTSIRFWCWCVSAMMVFSGVIVSLANNEILSKRSGECEAVYGNPDLECLYDIRGKNRAKPRSLLYRQNKKDLDIVYRGPASDQPKVERLDLTAGEVLQLPLPALSECIGAYYDEGRDLLLLVYVLRPNKIKPIKYHKKLRVFSGDFEEHYDLTFPEIQYCDYNAYMMETNGKIMIQGESTFYLDLDTRQLVRDDLLYIQRKAGQKQCDLLAETGFARVTDDRFVISGGGGAMMQQWFGDSACLIDPREGTKEIYQGAPFNGAWDAGYIPSRNEVFLSSFWRSYVMFLDADSMKEKRRFSIGPCVRPVAFDPKSNLGLTVECFAGRLVAFNIDSGRVQFTTLVGANTRTLLVTEDLGVLVGSECGIFRLLPLR